MPDSKGSGYSVCRYIRGNLVERFFVSPKQLRKRVFRVCSIPPHLTGSLQYTSRFCKGHQMTVWVFSSGQKFDLMCPLDTGRPHSLIPAKTKNLPMISPRESVCEREASHPFGFVLGHFRASTSENEIIPAGLLHHQHQPQCEGTAFLMDSPDEGCVILSADHSSRPGTWECRPRRCSTFMGR